LKEALNDVEMLSDHVSVVLDRASREFLIAQHIRSGEKLSKIAMRPGKPMMHGRLGAMRVIGLPGNPVSSDVCALPFLAPLIRGLSGRNDLRHRPEPALLGRDLAANDFREDYFRARLEARRRHLVATPVNHQDRSLLANLSFAQALVIRPQLPPAAATGSPCLVLRLPLQRNLIVLTEN
jgi:molybdopterin molybdotransferase